MAQEKWLVDGPKIIDVDMIRKLKVGMIAGQVNIIGHDEPGARVEVHGVRGKDLKISVDGDTLEIDHPQLGWDNFLEVFRHFSGNATADVSIRVPRNVQLKFGVVSASALISGLTEDASISTISGDLVIDSIVGDLQLNGVSGEISVRSHEGTVSARTISGDITVAGDIPRFTADTVGGDVYLDLTGQPDEVRLNTVTGAITTRLASGVAVQYKINTVSGRLQLDGSSVSGVRGSYSGKHGDLDGAWLEFKANTVSGNVSVIHSVTA